jgi:hypothetical protein
MKNTSKRGAIHSRVNISLYTKAPPRGNCGKVQVAGELPIPPIENSQD